MKKVNGAVAVFVETPTLTPTKPLIAAVIGVEAALELYELSCQATVSIIQAASEELTSGGLPGFDIYWAPAEPKAQAAQYWQGFPIANQGSGEQPDRIFNIYDALLKEHPFVIMIYADTPHITSSLFVKIGALFSQPSKAKDFIIGPVDYGGYYLFAGKKEVPLHVWKSVSYTDADAINKLAGTLNQTASVAWIEMHPSLEGIKDVERIKLLINQAGNLTPEQMKLRVFLNRALKIKKPESP